MRNVWPVQNKGNYRCSRNIASLSECESLGLDEAIKSQRGFATPSSQHEVRTGHCVEKAKKREKRKTDYSSTFHSGAESFLLTAA